MPKNSKPNSDNEVLDVMKAYCQKKEYNFSNAQLDYMAQNCYLYFESRGWKGISYWPAVAMRWVLTNLKDQPKQNYKPKLQKDKSVRDKILEEDLTSMWHSSIVPFSI